MQRVFTFRRVKPAGIRAYQYCVTDTTMQTIRQNGAQARSAKAQYSAGFNPFIAAPNTGRHKTSWREIWCREEKRNLGQSDIDKHRQTVKYVKIETFLFITGIYIEPAVTQHFTYRTSTSMSALKSFQSTLCAQLLGKLVFWPKRNFYAYCPTPRCINLNAYCILKRS